MHCKNIQGVFTITSETLMEGKVHIKKQIFYSIVGGRKFKVVPKNRKFWGNENERFIDIKITVSAQMCHKQGEGGKRNFK